MASFVAGSMAESSKASGNVPVGSQLVLEAVSTDASSGANIFDIVVFAADKSAEAKEYATLLCQSQAGALDSVQSARFMALRGSCLATLDKVLRATLLKFLHAANLTDFNKAVQGAAPTRNNADPLVGTKVRDEPFVKDGGLVYMALGSITSVTADGKYTARRAMRIARSRRH